jgi:hypothetical protein
LISTGITSTAFLTFDLLSQEIIASTKVIIKVIFLILIFFSSSGICVKIETFNVKFKKDFNH